MLWKLKLNFSLDKKLQHDRFNLLAVCTLVLSILNYYWCLG